MTQKVWRDFSCELASSVVATRFVLGNRFAVATGWRIDVQLEHYSICRFCLLPRRVWCYFIVLSLHWCYFILVFKSAVHYSSTSRDVNFRTFWLVHELNFCIIHALCIFQI